MDWRDPSSWSCGGSLGDPFVETAAAGGGLALEEALFVKAKEGLLQTSSQLAQTAAKYERWMEEQVRPWCYSLAADICVEHSLKDSALLPCSLMQGLFSSLC